MLSVYSAKSGKYSRKMSAGNASKMKFTRTETEYNMKSIRFLLLTITTMFVLISGLMIVLGLSVYTHYHSFSFFLEGTGYVFTPSILICLLGLVLIVITLFGLFGALRLSTCMVNSYAVLLFLLLITKLVVVVLTFTVDMQSLMGYLNIPVWDYPYDPEIAEELNGLQYSLSCCGSESYLDYRGLSFTSNHSTVLYPDIIDGEHVTTPIPVSCCIKSVDDAVCVMVKKRGCKEALADLVTQNSGVIGVLGVSVMFIEVLGITFALLLGRCIRKAKTERVFLAWKLKEQQISARQRERHRAEVEAEQADSVYIQKAESSNA